jgi:D-3-phosphoglycerate dehydrogenase
MNHRPFQIVVAERYGEAALAVLRKAGEVHVLDSYEESVLLRAVAEADALLVRTYAQVTARVIEAAPRLRVIGRGGVGLDNVNVQAARARGIPVVYTPAAATHSVAELTIGLMIALERHIVGAHAAVRAGQFAEARRVSRGRELHGLTMGIVGLGRIGRCVGRAAAGLGMNILFNDIVDVGSLDFEARGVDKPTLFSTADVVTLHVPLTPSTRGLVNAEVLAGFRQPATLINTARGAVVDLVALAAALQAGTVAGAALDVYDPEPPPPDHPILHAPHVLFSAHVGARTHSGLARMEQVVEDVVAVLNGGTPAYPAPPAEPCA